MATNPRRRDCLGNGEARRLQTTGETEQSTVAVKAHSDACEVMFFLVLDGFLMVLLYLNHPKATFFDVLVLKSLKSLLFLPNCPHVRVFQPHFADEIRSNPYRSCWPRPPCLFQSPRLFYKSQRSIYFVIQSLILLMKSLLFLSTQFLGAEILVMKSHEIPTLFFNIFC